MENKFWRGIVFAFTMIVLLTILLCFVVSAVDAKVYHRVYWKAATCYADHGVTASGTYVNRRTAANNYLQPGTRIRIVGRQPGPGGIRMYKILDRGSDWAMGDGHLDFWNPSASYCRSYGRRNVCYKIGWRKPTERMRRRCR